MVFKNVYLFVATIRDPNNVPCAIKNFRVIMKHLHAQQPSPSAGKKMMHDAVASNNLLGSEGILMNTLETENYYLKYCCKLCYKFFYYC